MSYSDFLSAMIELNGEVGEDLVKKSFLMISLGKPTHITRQQLFDTIRNSS